MRRGLKTESITEKRSGGLRFIAGKQNSSQWRILPKRQGCPFSRLLRGSGIAIFFFWGLICLRKENSTQGKQITLGK
jgi:hypothetical protein